MRKTAAALLPSLIASCVATSSGGGALSGPATAPERTRWEETSTHADVLAFLDRLEGLPHAALLKRFSFGTTTEGREMVAVAVADPAPRSLEELGRRGGLRVLVNGNIHGGEVEGKESIQMLLREFARGEHAELLHGVTLLFVPDFNADGNDRIDAHNRVTQNGPDGGVGERENAAGLDLNRDFLKLESPECRGMLELVRRFDPHFFMDLHTTNGSYHGYHLTYSPSLSTNVDPEIDGFARFEMIPAIRAAMENKHGWRIFDYGNFVGEEGEEQEELGDGGRRWATYDARPRFGTNYFGVRGRFSLLSEAYSYLPFEERVSVTRDFVLETLGFLASHAGTMRAITERADARVASGEGVFRFDTVLADPVPGEVLVGAIEEVPLAGDLGTRRVALATVKPETMGLQTGFRSRREVPLPWAFAVPEPPAGLRERLEAHGIGVEVPSAPEKATARVFVLASVKRAKTLYQGHHAVTVTGTFGGAAMRLLPTGTLVIRSQQPLGVLAAQLLDPRSEDSLATWDVFPGWIGGGKDLGIFPVLRLDAPGR